VLLPKAARTRRRQKDQRATSRSLFHTRPFLSSTLIRAAARTGRRLRPTNIYRYVDWPECAVRRTRTGRSRLPTTALSSPSTAVVAPSADWPRTRGNHHPFLPRLPELTAHGKKRALMLNRLRIHESYCDLLRGRKDLERFQTNSRSSLWPIERQLIAHRPTCIRGSDQVVALTLFRWICPFRFSLIQP